MVDPSFGTRIRRLSDRGAQGGLATAEYPQLQAFNADERRILVTTEKGFQIRALPSGEISHPELSLSLPRWHPERADTLIGFNDRRGSAGPIRVRTATLEASGSVTYQDGIALSAMGFTEIDKGAWEDVSLDGRFMPLLGRRSGGVTAAVLDMQRGTLTATLAVNNVDWVAISPSGKHLLVQYVKCGAGPDAGLAIYDASSGAALGHASDHYEHGDLGIDESGAEGFYSIALEGLCPRGERARLTATPLSQGLTKRRTLREFIRPVGFYTTCRNLRRGGFCLHSDDQGTPGAAPFSGELWLSRTSDGAVRRLAHHRSSGASYYTLVRPVLSPSGRYALFSSDWAQPNDQNQSDMYLIDLSQTLDGFVGLPSAESSQDPQRGCGCRRSSGGAQGAWLFGLCLWGAHRRRSRRRAKLWRA